MPEAVAIAGLHQHLGRRCRRQKRRARRVLAAVMRRRQECDRPDLHACAHRSFLPRRNVSGKQHAQAAKLDQQHAAHRVCAAAERIVLDSRMQHRHVQLAEAKLLAGGAALHRPRFAQHRMLRIDRGDYRCSRHRAQQACGATGVIAVQMRDDQRVEPADAAPAQIRQDHAAAGIGLRGVARPGVHQKTRIARFDQHRRALADVDCRHPQFLDGRTRRRPQHQRQQADQPQTTQRPAARHQQPQHASQRERQRPRGRRRQRQRCPAPCGHAVQRVGKQRKQRMAGPKRQRC